MESTAWYTVISIWVGLILAFLALWFYTRSIRRRTREESETLIALARREADVIVQEERAKAELEIKQKEAEFRRLSDRQSLETELQLKQIAAREENLEHREIELKRRLAQLKEESETVQQQKEDLRLEALRLRRDREQLAGLSEEDIKRDLREELKTECQDELRHLRRDLLERSETEVQQEARRLLVTSMQRLTTRPTTDITATIVQLPNDDMKGRIIGREGRNIKCFEAATGTTLLIDESPQMVLISSFDPVRREIARVALEGLVADGRIHPATIEDFVDQARREVDSLVQLAGESAADQLRISSLSQPVIQLLGQLKFRYSYTQNVLDHSIEVALLCSMLASELRLDPAVAKRAGLLHDIGKAIDSEYEGSHALVGADFIRRHGEDPLVVNAVAAHHEEVKPESIYAGLVILADTVSAIRPGARAESMAAYIDRLDRLEKLACSLEGVQGAYAIQAGREIRVLVEPEKLDDHQASQLARTLRRRIEEELQYPSTIKVTVIREQRFTETAK
ncbi:MAG: ribonuclease Y [Puniceicoccaceae bacterium]|nr:MAG: ribonuclease Y [Puniceicoccaceae bacterium]